MSIGGVTELRRWLVENQRVVIQGGTGRVARAQLSLLRAAGTNVVAAVAPGRDGHVDGVPVFSDVSAARDEAGANISLMFVPSAQARSACEEALDAGIELVVILAENMPVLDALAIKARESTALLIGPNSPGLAMPGVVKLGFMPSPLLTRGSVGLVSRSGTLSYEVALELARVGLGISVWIGIGGDTAPLTDMPTAAALAAADEETDALVVVGELGGTGEERLADMIVADTIDVPVHALIVGREARGDEPLGHAGAVRMAGAGTFETKTRRLKAAGVSVHDTPWDLADALARHRRR